MYAWCVNTQRLCQLCRHCDELSSCCLHILHFLVWESKALEISVRKRMVSVGGFHWSFVFVFGLRRLSLNFFCVCLWIKKFFTEVFCVCVWTMKAFIEDFMVFLCGLMRLSLKFFVCFMCGLRRLSLKFYVWTKKAVTEVFFLVFYVWTKKAFTEVFLFVLCVD